MFLFLALLLVLGTVAVIVWPLLKKVPPSAQDPSDKAIADVFKERKKLIQRELESGLIQAEEAARAQEALAQELADRLDSTIDSASPSNLTDSPSTLQPRRPWLAALLALSLPVLGLSIYLVKGSPELALPGTTIATQAHPAMRSFEALVSDPAAYKAQVDQWKSELQARPDAVDLWLNLALAQKTAANFDEALESFTEALKRGADQDGRILAEFAETLALARGKRFEGEPYALLKRAIAIEPNDSKVVSLMAAAHFQVGEKAQARVLLEQLLAAMPADSPQAEQLKGLIATLPADAAGQQAVAGQADGADQQGRGDQKASIMVRLGIDPDMLNGLPSTAVLYVSARAAEGPRMPIAVWRSAVSELKLEDAPGLRLEQKTQTAGSAGSAKALVVSLTQAQQLSPSRPLQGRLVVEAHLSQSGQAGRQPGDPIARGAEIDLGDAKAQSEVSLRIDSRFQP